MAHLWRRSPAELDDDPGVDGILPDDRGVGIADAQLVGAGDLAGAPGSPAGTPAISIKERTSTSRGLNRNTMIRISMGSESRIISSDFSITSAGTTGDPVSSGFCMLLPGVG